ncbi:MAG: hypothetical protein A2Y62_20345 [Candidatus Fischerbacteria bacterium RBG_13_37_8]|uniref:Dihydrolipoyllysine-residue succinyltransferase component of 2-oxoglutarate dehydrogenase complex n=1 Tax=Candidatus Fischerbacteria bacterium RBG_13_37_8 TaxID=1817863 RepID=A0A1F5VVI2_9BACT|nr:MAG: hypothetical protein A2Y62_20345 [Candidatus Fischerbacteria bacterium RBG_13_37_8]
MKIEVIMPQMGESIAEGTLSKWLKQEGDAINKEEPLYEVSTDKIDTEIQSPETGILSKILVKEGETVPVNTVVAYIETEKKQVEEKEREEIVFKEEKSVTVEIAVHEEKAHSEMRLSPAVRKLLREHDIEPAQIAGTGANGRITARDVLLYVDEKTKKHSVEEADVPRRARIEEQIITPVEKMSPVKPGEKIAVVPMTTMRKRIAEHMILSRKTSAHVTTVFEVDMTNIVKMREQLKAQYEKEGVKLTYIAFIISAIVKALKANPIVNASVSDFDIIYKKEINIGIAVALDWGLIVPVIKEADTLSLLGIAQAVQDLSERARTKKLKLEEVQDGTFSITNPGVFGALMGTPIINQPQVAILGMGAIVKRPVVINDAIAIRHIMYLSLSYDHRIIDGATADAFLAHIKNTLENYKG